MATRYSCGYLPRYIFPHFGLLHQEKAGIPADQLEKKKKKSKKVADNRLFSRQEMAVNFRQILCVAGQM
jgi:hypothetical protein